MSRYIAVRLWAGLILGCAGAASSSPQVSGAPDAGVDRSARARPDAGLADEPHRPLPISGCGQNVTDCPGTGGGGTAPAQPPSPSMPSEGPQGPGPDPSPID